MVQRRGGAGVLVESLPALGVTGDRGGKDLQSEVAIEPGVASPPHLAHSSRSERREDLVGAEARAGGERHQTTRTSPDSSISPSLVRSGRDKVRAAAQIKASNGSSLGRCFAANKICVFEGCRRVYGALL